MGGLLYTLVAGIALLGGMGGVTDLPAAYQAMLAFVVFGLPVPMIFGWIPAAHRLVVGKKGPWVSAGIMGAIAIALPIVSLVILSKVR